MDLIQYQIVLINLDPTIGSEMQKTRPCLIISPNEMNRHLQTIVIAPITNSTKPYPTRIEIKQNKTKGWVVLDQVRTIDRQRVIKTYGVLNEKEIMQIKSVLKEIYVD